MQLYTSRVQPNDPSPPRPPMSPQPEPTQPPVDPKTEAAQDAYAQALLKVATLEYNDRQAHIEQPKHFFSKKRLIWLAVSTILSIIIGAVANHLLKQGSGTTNPSAAQSQQELKGAVNFDNPNAY